jgi:Malectin domain
VAGLLSQIVSPVATAKYTLTATNAGGSVTRSVTITVTPLPPVSLPFSMNTCGPKVANFVAEVAAYAAGGNCTTVGSPSVNVAGVANAAPAAVYQTKRTGQNGVGFTYTIQLPSAAVLNPLYTVRLHFADDLSTVAGQRIFKLVINGSVVQPNLDIFATTGQKMKALVKEFGSVSVNTRNQIVIQGLYVNSGQNPLINGLEIIPQQ